MVLVSNLLQIQVHNALHHLKLISILKLTLLLIRINDLTYTEHTPTCKDLDDLPGLNISDSNLFGVRPTWWNLVWDSLSHHRLVAVVFQSCNRNLKYWCVGAGAVGTHVLILSSEMWSCGLVQSHDHSHHVFAVEDGRSQNVPGLVLGEFVDEWAEMLVLPDRKHT